MKYVISRNLLGVLGLLCLSVSAVKGTEIPQSADDFVNSMGVNTHVRSTQVFDSGMFAGLGIRHLRDNVKPVDFGATPYNRLAFFYSNNGISTDIVCDTTSFTPVQYQGLLVNPCFESIEGLNEPDNQTTGRTYGSLSDNVATNSYPATNAFQQDLYTAVKGASSTSSKLVYSPAMGEAWLSSYLNPTNFDVISMHGYPQGQPLTGNGLPDYFFDGARLMVPPGGTIPSLLTSEVGYKQGTASADISELAGGKYIPRIMAEYYLRDSAKTYLFEMVDTPGVYDYGLLRKDLTAKPSYTNLQNMISLLKEATWNTSTLTWSVPTVTPRPLDYTLTGAAAGAVRHLLLQKSNGDYYLLLWQGVSSYNVATHADISNPSVPVTLTFNTPMSAGYTYLLGSTSATNTYTAPRSIAVNVLDEITIVRLTPNLTPPVIPSPAVTIAATNANAVESPITNGAYTVFRTGATTSPLTVNYSVGGLGSAYYAAFSGNVTIPAGASSSAIPLDPTGRLNVKGDLNTVLNVTSGSYSIGYLNTSSIPITTGSQILNNFEAGNITGWNAQARSTVSLDSANPDTGLYDLKWLFNYDGVTTWSNAITYTLPAVQDWTAISKIRIRIKEDASNPSSDFGQPLYFDFDNNGVYVSGGSGVESVALWNGSYYRTIDLDLGNFPRSQVSALKFYVQGTDFSVGNHTWYIDNISAVLDRNGLLADMEDGIMTPWSSQSLSTITLDSTVPDTGVHDLKWTYTNNGSTRWSNKVVLTLPNVVDWTNSKQVVLRFREDPGNPSKDVGNPIYFDLTNNGVSTSGGSCVAQFSTTGSSTYRTIPLKLGSFARDKVSNIIFYVDGNFFGVGSHTWYLDNISLQ